MFSGNKKRLLELAGIPHELHKKILENVEDEQSAACGAIEDKLEQMPDGPKKDAAKKEYNRCNAMFSDGYEKDDDDLMYDGLDSLRALASKL